MIGLPTDPKAVLAAVEDVGAFLVNVTEPVVAQVTDALLKAMGEAMEAEVALPEEMAVRIVMRTLVNYTSHIQASGVDIPESAMAMLGELTLEMAKEGITI